MFSKQLVCEQRTANATFEADHRDAGTEGPSSVQHGMMKNSDRSLYAMLKPSVFNVVDPYVRARTVWLALV